MAVTSGPFGLLNGPYLLPQRLEIPIIQGHQFVFLPTNLKSLPEPFQRGFQVAQLTGIARKVVCHCWRIAESVTHSEERFPCCFGALHLVKCIGAMNPTFS